LTARLVDESERRAAEANKLKEELLRARVAEKQAKEKLLEFLSRNAYINTVRKKLSTFSFLITFNARVVTCSLYYTQCFDLIFNLECFKFVFSI